MIYMYSFIYGNMYIYEYRLNFSLHKYIVCSWNWINTSWDDFNFIMYIKIMYSIIYCVCVRCIVRKKYFASELWIAEFAIGCGCSLLGTLTVYWCLFYVPFCYVHCIIMRIFVCTVYRVWDLEYLLKFWLKSIESNTYLSQ